MCFQYYEESQYPGVFSTLGDILSILGMFSTVEGFMSIVGGILSTVGDVQSGCSMLWGVNMIHVGIS